MTYPSRPAAYVDGSAPLAVAFGEPSGPGIARRLSEFTVIYSSNLLEAELRAAYHRERREFDPQWLYGVEWVLPTRPLGPEIADALQVRYLRSGDLLHIATALYAHRTFGLELTFITLDHDQRDVATGLGFPV